MSLTRSESKLPPMLAQYREYQNRYPDTIIFFQVGDFYEIFFEQAPVVARSLNLTLTSRDKESPDPIPMCGIPVAVADSYVERLVAQGFSVAMVSQVAAVSSPERGSQTKGMVPRHLERIVTPGIRILGGLGGSGERAVVAGLVVSPAGETTCAFTDTESGTIWVRENIQIEDLVNELHREDIAEVVLAGEIDGRPMDRRSGLVRQLERIVRSQVKFRSVNSARSFGANWLEGVATLPPRSRDAVYLLLAYIGETTVNPQSTFVRVGVRSLAGIMAIDAATRVNLELVERGRERAQQGSLYDFLRQTKTEVGAALLRRWILAPSTNVSIIKSRLVVVRALVAHSVIRGELRDLLGRVPHFDRIATRIGLGVVTPAELGALRSGLTLIPELLRCVEQVGLFGREEASDFFALLQRSLPTTVYETLDRLADNAPLSINDGGIFSTGVDVEIDRLRRLTSDSKSLLVEFEGRLRNETGISSLKVKSNNVIGYFIEITRTHVDKVPPDFIRRQSTAQAERFVVAELKALEEEILSADHLLRRRERDLFLDLRRSLVPIVEQVRGYSEAIANLDVLAGFAELGDRSGFVEPEVDESRELLIEEGRHPVLEAILREEFVPNSLRFAGDSMRCIVLTGPNMGGKSTYLRQAALITIMAQIGAFVPAKRARIGIVDKIFARIGASDNLLEGESTFMVEMRETATIIRNATDASLVLVDEIGRGTSTTDGLALAQAIVEWLVDKIGARSICATHFHQLTALEADYSARFGEKQVVNFTVGCCEEGDRIYFTHHILPGPGDKSYGLEVAHLAGLPEELIARAKELLELDHSEVPARSEDLSREMRPGKKRYQRSSQMVLFPELSSDFDIASVRRSLVAAQRESARLGQQLQIEKRNQQQLRLLVEDLAKMHCEHITPIAAMVALNRLADAARGILRDPMDDATAAPTEGEQIVELLVTGNQ